MMTRPSPRRRTPRPATIFALALALVLGWGAAQPDVASLRRAAQANPDDAEAWIALGDALYGGEDYGAAKDAFLEGVAADYRNCDAHYGLGLSEFGRGDFQASLFAFNEVTRLCAERFDGHYNRGVALTRLRRPADAAEAFRTALDVAEPEASRADRSSAWLGLAGQLELAGDHAAAAEAYGSALALNEGDREIAFRRAQALYRAGSGLDALPELAALEAQHDDYRITGLIADIYVDEGQIDYGLRALERALAAAEANEDRAAQAAILVDLGLLQRELGRSGESARSFQRASRIDGASWEAFYNLGVSYLESGQTRSALEPLETAGELRPENGAVQLALASAYDQLAQTDAALQAARAAVSALDEADRVAQARFILGRSLYRQGDYAAAAREFELVVAARPSDAAVQLWAGLAEYQLGNYRSAALFYERSVQLDPATPEGRINLGAAYLASERYEDAEAVYGALVQQNPTDAESFYNLGWSLLGQERRGAGRDAWGSACDLGYQPACDALQRYF